MRRQLEALYQYLTENYPLSASKLLVVYEDAVSVKAPCTLLPTLSEAAGYFLPNLKPTRKLPYTGLIEVAMRSTVRDPLNTLVHEYRHAMQHDEGRYRVADYWDLELDAIKFARTTLAEYQAQLPVAKSKPQNLKKAA